MTAEANELMPLDLASQNAHTWAAYKRSVSDRIADAVEAFGISPSSDSKLELVSLQRLHHVVYVADRIRKAAIRSRKPFPAALQQAAEMILAKPYSKGKDVGARSPQEERYVVGARVNWHKLMKRAEAAKNQRQTGAPGRLSLLRAQVQEELNRLVLMIEENKAANPEATDEFEKLAKPLRTCLENFECGRDSVELDDSAQRRR